ncbi:MAG: cell division protein ZapC, partial [Vibrio casei]
MLKPSDTWKWYYDETNKSLMLDLGLDMVFSVNLPEKLLINSAFQENQFSVDDASSYHK